MRPTIHFRLLAALGLWLSTLLAAHATHIIGGELLYSPVASTTAGVPRYHVTARLQRDVTSIQQPSIDLICSYNGCAATTPGSFTATLPQTRTAATYRLGCTASPYYYIYEVDVYEVDVDLPRGQWLLSTSFVNRAIDLINVTNSINTGIYLSAYLDNALVSQNASPKFLSTLLPYVPNVEMQRFSFSAFDGEGDSLTYQLVLPQQNFPPAAVCGTTLPGALLAPHFQLNAATGALTAPAPTAQQGKYALAARVNEYRRVNGDWQLIGYITRDITYVAFSSTNQTPRFTGLALNGAAPTPLSQLIRVQPGQTVTLALTAVDPDAGQVLRFESQSPDVIPGLRFQTTGPTTAQLTWQVPSSLPLGRYTAAVAVLDNGCPNASEDYTFSFLVTTQPLTTHAEQRIEATAYPMPFREQVQFQAGSAQVVSILDVLGRVVAHLSSPADGRVMWRPAPTLPPGLYIARGANGQLLARLQRAAE